MLKLTFLQDPSERWKLISKLNPETDLYLVTDIKSKKQAESYLLKKHDCFPNDSVLQISHFFKNLFLETYSDWHIVSEVFLKKYFLKYSENHSDPNLKYCRNVKEFFNYFQAFLPILSHPEGEELINDWFKDNSGAQNRWKYWYDISKEFFHELKDKKWMYENGLKSFLLNENFSKTDTIKKLKKIIIDLEVNFDFCEQDILSHLSQYVDIEIIIPQIDETLVGESYFLPYKRLVDQFGNKNQSTDKVENKKKIKKTTYKTSLSEVKHTCAQLRTWIDEGVPVDQIAVIASDIEKIWPVLKPHLDKEGIMYRKDISSSLKDFPEVMYWLSQIKVHLKDFNFSDLEYIKFYKDETNFEKFKNRYTNVPERYTSKDQIKKKEELVSCYDFIDWAVNFWPSDGKSELLELSISVFKDVFPEIQLSYLSWLQILQTQLNSKEKSIYESSKTGISVLSLNAFYSISPSHVCLLGLDHDSMKNKNLTSFNKKDWIALIEDLGFPIPFLHPHQKEISLQWFLQSSKIKELNLSYAEQDFQTQFQNPCPLFLEFGNTESKESSEDAVTFWEESKSLSCNKILETLGYEKTQAETLEKNIKDNTHSFAKFKLERASHSQIEMYKKCPFLYASKYLLHLKDDDVLKRDFSDLWLGSKLHKALEHMVVLENVNFNDEQIREKLKAIPLFDQNDLNYNLVHNQQQKLLEDIFVSIIKQVLKSVSDNFKHNGLKPYKNELGFECYWNLKTQSFEKEGDILFKGKMDRVDLNQKNKFYVLIDYKKGHSSKISNFKSWFGNNLFQFGIYIQIIEKSLAEGVKALPVKGALYQALQNNTFKGYLEPDVLDLKLQKSTRENMEQFLDKMNTSIGKSIHCIQAGQFPAEPEKAKTCVTCGRRKWCRNPKLF